MSPTDHRLDPPQLRGSSGRPARRAYFSLRLKLVTLSLTLLVIPWIGYRYLNEMEAFLRHGKEDALLAAAGAVARVLHEQPALFTHGGPLLRSAGDHQHLYVRSLPTPIHLDGYADDWSAYRERARHFGSAGDGDATSFDLLTGTRDQYLYALLQVRDDHVVYREPGAGTATGADHLLIALQTPQGELRRYILASTAPGWVGAQQLPPGGIEAGADLSERRIRAEWQESGAGYTLELRIPLAMVGNRLSFAIVDVDDPRTRATVAVVATAGTDTLQNLGTLTVPTPAMDRLLQGMERQQGRLWIVDKQQRVLAMAGDLRADDESPASPARGVLHALYRLILKEPASDFQDDLSDVSRLQSPEVSAALRGREATRWRRSPDDQANIVSAAFPIWVGNQVVGAAVAEETSRDILLLQNRALEHLLNLSLVTFLVALMLLLTLSTRLAQRIRHLRDQAEGAITADGRVTGRIDAAAAGDEIGDLSRSFAGLLERLQQYTRYLETMAAKLSHELRTPLAVVRSSLDNLDVNNVTPEQRVYTERARGGLSRLEGIVNRMSEASRLEQAFEHAEPETHDLGELLAGCVAGYRGAHPQREFVLQVPAVTVPMTGVPDLLAQMLDKLVANALDFATAGTPIEISLEYAESVILRVRNQGPPLPAEMEGSLFDSMVSLRSARSDESHLGLGLYIVRLVAQFHGGRVRARSTVMPAGAEFVVVLPATATDIEQHIQSHRRTLTHGIAHR